MSNTLPDVDVIEENGNLGRSEAQADGTSGMVLSGVAVSGKFALGDILGPYSLPEDADADGINAAYDATNTCMVYQHIADFYDKPANRGTQLYIMVVAKTVTLTQMCTYTNAYAAKLLEQTEGKIKLLGVARIPDGGYTPGVTKGFDDDAYAAIAKAQELAESEWTKHRPVRIIIEGRLFQGSASGLHDLRDIASTPAANKVGVVIGANTRIAALRSANNKYAAVGYTLGVMASLPVQRNIGRVLNGALSIVAEEAGFSDGTNISTQNDTNTELMNKKGYIFFRKHAQKSGIFFNDDHAACKLSDDYAYLSNGRIIDKAARITRQVYVENILDDFDVDAATGKIAPAVLKQYQGNVESEINSQMVVPNEIVSVKATVDPNQDVQSTDKVVVGIKLRKKGTQRYLEANLGFATTN